MPETNLVAQLLLPVSLAIIMMSVGLELTLPDFRAVATRPKALVIGALAQVFVLPLVASGLASVWDLPPLLAVGVMIIAACPGGVTSNLMTYLARGETALSVTLTALISLLSVVTLPLVVGFALDHFVDPGEGIDLSIGTTVLGVFLITTVPVAIGMAIKHGAPSFAARCEQPARIMSTVLFAVIILGAIYAERDNAVQYFAAAGSIALTLNLLMLALAMGFARAARLSNRQAIAITLECGLQNGTLAVFVALTLIGSRDMMIPGAIYSLIMFPTAIAYTLYAKRMADSERP